MFLSYAQNYTQNTTWNLNFKKNVCFFLTYLQTMAYLRFLPSSHNLIFDRDFNNFE